ncbi:pimeloyl-[acyl-carrier protein] methyl ester esterase [Alysiella filiformis DSM 16848]|uniref:Pimeloyl-[acyl-carrier protein] methyl ester esterase n=2 Tax=Alysiella TaxID=194195 RepID=A0A286ECW3_9NEIS|nr:pimeloyl-[acyl-carrier protein] methyl ester esterase [Alysiella filiformis DSM 16848]
MMKQHLVLIHGWGVNRHIFDDFRRRLPEHWHSFAPNLLGHGDEPCVGDFTVARAAERIASQIAPQSVVLGWSLGGLVALHLAAHYADKVRGLILCSSFAKLLAEPDYPAGLTQSALHKMIPLFEQDYRKFMRQFLELQLLHSPYRDEILHNVLPDVAKWGAPQALRGALAAVEQADFRAQLGQIRQPSLLIYGGKDAITPPCMGDYLQQHLPHAQIHKIDKAAHAPFLSHADEVVAIVQNWIE